MKVLFISSGNAKDGISPIVKNQGESLKRAGIDLEFFAIEGKGIKGYLRAIFKLRKHLKKNSYDLFHAHYWLSGIVATLGGAKPLVVSLMGDDVKTKEWIKWIIFIFYKLFWAKTIVKSKDMFNAFAKDGVEIVPNGVDFNRFKPIDKEIAQQELGWDSNKKHILFTSDPNRYEKNFKLTKEAFDLINDGSMQLHYMVGIENSKVPIYYNAADVVILTSLWEGSPNAIKEAMACSRPIVATDVGDVRDNISKTKGCFVATFDAKDVASKLKEALKYQKTSGREDIAHLRDDVIAQKLIKIYNEIKDR